MNRIPHLRPLEHGLVVASCHGKVKEDAQRLRANTIGGKVKGVVQFFQGLEAELNGLAMFFFLPKLGETGCQDNLSVLLARKIAYFACKLLAMVIGATVLSVQKNTVSLGFPRKSTVAVQRGLCWRTQIWAASDWNLEVKRDQRGTTKRWLI